MYVCNGCHDLLMMFIYINGIAILNINGVDYPCNINRISKSEVVNLLQNSDETEIEKHKFHQQKHLISIYNVNINKILVSNKVFFVKKSFKYFIGYRDSTKNSTVMNNASKNEQERF